MARKYQELRARMSPERRARNDRETEKELAALSLSAVRQAVEVTQQELARRLNVTQANISRMEQRDDLHISTLRKAIEALGGELEIRANFPSTGMSMPLFKHN